MSDLASASTDGQKVSDPVFPFQLKFVPSGLYNFAEDDERYFTEQLKTIQPNTKLFDVFAMETPSSEWEVLGTFDAASEFVTSNWGDEHLFFRHQLVEEDVKLMP